MRADLKPLAKLQPGSPWSTMLLALALAFGLLLFGAWTVVQPDLRWGAFALLGIFVLLGLLSSPELCALLAALTVFTGVLLSVPVGFTLKAPQLLMLVGLGAWGLRCLLHRRVDLMSGLQLRWLLPFGLFYFGILPSLWRVDITALSLRTAESSLRLLVNYSLLQGLVLLFWLTARSPQQQERLYRAGLLSCGFTLAVGYLQQIAFYLGRYDPLQFVGRHQSIVDFYGPFLRFSPGTFANEYGEILQSVAILILARWVSRSRSAQSPPPQAPAFWRGLEILILMALVPALILNFTRASWLVLAAAILLLMLLARVRLSLVLLCTSLLGLSLLALWWLSQRVLEFSILLSLTERFQELSDVQSFSAGQRLVTWDKAWQAFLQSPWIGNGWGRFGETHNVPLQLLAETGLLGLLAFYALMFWILGQQIRAWWVARLYPTLSELRARQLGYALALWACLCFDLTNHGIYHFVLWFVIALGLVNARSILYSEESKGEMHVRSSQN